ncbi:MAG: carbohydrate-binding protein, partial [Gammaproteobacteria bacterium]
MQKHLIEVHDATPAEHDWLELSKLADVEITSEAFLHPIEAALLPNRTQGWRAAAAGRQVIRLRFKTPQTLRRIALAFSESALERTQEYVLRWSPDHGRSMHDIVRQQWNFSPAGSTSETEDHAVELDGVTLLELELLPDINGGTAVAT